MYNLISDEEYLRLRDEKIKMINAMALGKGVLDDLTQEINSILDNYRDDYDEINCWGYDMDNGLERNTLLEILEKIDTNYSFSDKEKMKAVSFLEELKEDFIEMRQLNLLNTLIKIINV